MTVATLADGGTFVGRDNDDFLKEVLDPKNPVAQTVDAPILSPLLPSQVSAWDNCGGGVVRDDFNGGTSRTAFACEDTEAPADAEGMARRTANTGPFAELEVSMQKRSVLRAAKAAGIDLGGVSFKIDRSLDLMGRNVFGHTSLDGKILVFPDAFRSMEDLVKTIGHERTHVMQFRLYGEHTDRSDWERAAYAAEEQFLGLL
ncbi:hypothetical protein [Amycolatopsis sp. NPDC102389]|uniref:hypothetical protein n=1 Tax=Amycolatopsis sp. NPDC102389 TaxID=3363941 RepID=UPI0037FFE27C